MKKITIKQKNKKTFDDGFEEFILNCRARNLRQTTINHYFEGYRAIEKMLDTNILISDITIHTVENFIIKYSETNIKTQTLHTYTRDLKTILYYFMRMEYMKSFKIKLPQVDKENIETYTDAELRILLKKPNIKKCSFVEYRDYVIVNFLLSTGVRLTSLINVKVDDVDFQNNVVYVNVTKTRRPIIIPLNSTLKVILKEYLKIRKNVENEYLFCTCFGNKLCKNTLNTALRQYHFKRGIAKTGIHRYRHTFAKKWIISGGSVVTLQKLLGHKSLNMTENYINLLVSDLKKEVNKFDILKEFNKNYIKI